MLRNKHTILYVKVFASVKTTEISSYGALSSDDIADGLLLYAGFLVQL